jgi:hypothetical protein
MYFYVFCENYFLILVLYNVCKELVAQNFKILKEDCVILRKLCAYMLDANKLNPK